MRVKHYTQTTIIAAALALSASAASAFGFDICEDVTMRLHNNSGSAIQVYDLDYYDYGQSRWRSEPLEDTIVQPGYYYSFTRNLEDVENAETLLRFRYRTIQGGQWSGRNDARGNTFTCRHNTMANVYVN